MCDVFIIFLMKDYNEKQWGKVVQKIIFDDSSSFYAFVHMVTRSSLTYLLNFWF